MVALTTKEKLQMITIIASLHRTAQLKFSQQKMLFFFSTSNQDAHSTIGKSSRAWYLGHTAVKVAFRVATTTEKAVEGDSHLPFSPG